MTENLWLNILIAIGIAGTAEEVVRRVVGRPVVRAWRKFERFLDAWNGEPPRDGLAGRPGVVERLTAIEAQVHNNGGSSMKDAVDRIERKVDVHIQDSKALIADGEKREQRIWEALDTRKALDNITEALPIVARSTPHEEDGN